MTVTIYSYRDLEVWKEAMRLAHLAYDCTNRFPPIERYVLLTQVRRAALSIPANIAEGRGRAHTGEFLNFLSNSRGSLHELESHLIFAHQREYLTEAELAIPMEKADHVSRQLNRLRRSLILEEPHPTRRR